MVVCFVQFLKQGWMSINLLLKMGITSIGTHLDALSTWRPRVGYGLGLWIAFDEKTGVKIVHILGKYNSHVIMFDIDSEEPTFTQGVSLTENNWWWTVPSGLFRKAMVSARKDAG
jgi:hypothetical protein